MKNNVHLIAYMVLVMISAYLYSIHAETRHYISSDSYKKYADYIVDQNNPLAFNPAIIPPKKTIYVSVSSVGYFFERIFPFIKVPFILITNREDDDRSAPGEYAAYLDDDRIIAWFGQNCDCYHPKFIPIPIGLANDIWPHGDKEIFDNVLDEIDQRAPSKKDLLYVNFQVETNFSYRQRTFDFFKDKNFVFVTQSKPPLQYLHELATYKFVLSPWGNGLDCHRTWEALLVGSIPVIESSTLDRLFDDLPVIIVKNWSLVTLEFLIEKEKEFSFRKFNYEKLFLDYWLDCIEKAKK